MKPRVLLMLLLLVNGRAWAAQTAGPEGKRTETIQGVVIDATSNEPVPRALVILKKGDEPGIGTYTDAAGKFTFHAADPGDYTILAEHEGFVADPRAGHYTITVIPGVLSDAVTLELNRTGAISGRVIDANGEPVTGAGIQLEPMRLKRSQSSAVSYATTDDNGNYRAYHIAPGKYRVFASYSPGREHPDVKMQIEKDGANDASAEVYGKTYYPGTLDVLQATVIQIDPGADLHGIDIGLLHTRSVRISGHVNSAAGPLIMLVMLSPIGGGSSIDSRVREDGSFEFTQVPPGRYVLTAIGILSAGQQVTANQRLDVSATDIDGVQLTLARPQTVTGAVIMPANRKVPRGLAIILEPREQLSTQDGGFAQLHEDGGFSVENVMPGDYDVVLANPGKGDDLYIDSMHSGGQDVFSSGLHIGAAPSPPVEIVLKSNGAEIDCTVLDGQQKTPPEAQVVLLPDSPHRSHLALREECQTDASGKCVLLGVAPGSYHAFAFAKEDRPDFHDPDAVAGLGTGGEAVTVAQGDKKLVQLEIIQSEQQR